MTVIERVKKEIEAAKSNGFIIDVIHAGSGVWGGIVRELNVTLGVAPSADNELRLGLTRVKLADFVGYEHIVMYGSKSTPIVDRMMKPLP